MTLRKIRRALARGAIILGAYTAGHVIAAQPGSDACCPTSTLPEEAMRRLELALATVAEGGGFGGGAGGGGGAVIALGGASSDEAADHAKEVEKRLIIRGIEPGTDLPFGSGETTYLGVGAEEAPEILASQLSLDPGIGLVVKYVTPDSPAAKAGLEKNDLLVEFEGQGLSVPAQLRKLVQARKEGDEVKLAYYRAGKRYSTTATLGKTKGGFGLLKLDEGKLQDGLRELQWQLREGPFQEKMRDLAHGLRESLGDLKVDQEKIGDEVRRSLEEAKRAVEEALREATNAKHALAPTEKALKEIEESKVLVDKHPSVVVRSTNKTVRSLVKVDDSGRLIIVATPELHLTAHDKDGKLLFDGPVDTQEQQDTIPRDLWERVQPLLDQIKNNEKAEDEPDR